MGLTCRWDGGEEEEEQREGRRWREVEREEEEEEGRSHFVILNLKMCLRDRFKSSWDAENIEIS